MVNHDTADAGQDLFCVTVLALQWPALYVTDRLMTFTVNHISSVPKRLDFGVPQGSILGLLLFVLYTHPLFQIVLDSGVYLHKNSDDTQLFNSAPFADFNPFQTRQSVVWIMSEFGEQQAQDECGKDISHGHGQSVTN